MTSEFYKEKLTAKSSRMSRAVYLLSLDTTIEVPPVQLLSVSPGEVSELFWITNDSFAYLNESSLYSISTNYTVEAVTAKNHLLDFPSGVNPSNLQYESQNNIIAFTGMIWEGEGFENVPVRDKMYEERGNTGMVYDELYIRLVAVVIHDS